MTVARPSVKHEQMALTRRRILDACAELALRYGGLDDPAAFTYARVAELSGVSERTVYRAFPTKNDLTAAFLNEATLTRGEPVPEVAAELAPFVRRVSRTWAEQFPPRDDDRPTGDLVPEHERASVLHDEVHAGRVARDAAIQAAIAGALPERMSPPEQRAIGGVIRLLTSFRSIAQTAARFDVSLAEAGDAHAWAIETLIGGLSDTDEETTQ